MKTRILFFLSFVLMTFFSSCSNDNSGIANISYAVTLEYPDNYSSTLVEGATITVKNLSTNIEMQFVTNESGIVSFEIAPGNYSITASLDLTAEQAETLTGVAESLYLNATVSQVSILETGSTTLKLEGSTIGDWVIKEYYYTGVPSYYFYDGFIEIYNNSTTTLYADGLLFGNTASSSNTSVNGFVATGEQDVYLLFVFRIPGDGTEYPVEPGESIVIAVDGIDHKTDPNGNPNSPVNLGPEVADFEVYFYVNPNDKDTDNPDVPNIEIIYSHSTTLFDYLAGVFGSGLIIFDSENPETLDQVTEPNSTSSKLYVKVPKEDVIDGLDAVRDETTTPEYKRLATNIDAGMNTVNGSYNGTSLRRKIKQVIGNRKVLVDTNNSSNDFETNTTPSPKGW